MHREKTPAGKALEALCASPQLGAVAAQLLAAKRVRLYQSCFFVKEPGMGPTNWHSDLNMVPLDTNQFVTAWLPLHSLTGAGTDLRPEVKVCSSHAHFR